MQKFELTPADFDLINTALSEFNNNLNHSWHGVASGIRLVSGKIITGLVLETENPSLTVCAEPIVIGKALDSLTHDPIEVVVAVRKAEKTEHKVIPPCGRCREFITDYAPDSRVIVYDHQSAKLFKVKAKDLLPFKYKNTPGP